MIGPLPDVSFPPSSGDPDGSNPPRPGGSHRKFSRADAERSHHPVVFVLDDMAMPDVESGEIERRPDPRKLARAGDDGDMSNCVSCTGAGRNPPSAPICQNGRPLLRRRMRKRGLQPLSSHRLAIFDDMPQYESRTICFEGEPEVAF